MKTTLYLIRQAAALEARPGRSNPPLSQIGIRQAEVTRDFLALRAIDACYCSPSWSAVQTAEIIAAPHGLRPEHLDSLHEQGATDAVRRAFEEVVARHAGGAVLVVGHRRIHQTYLAAMLGISPARAAGIALEHCGISVIVRAGAETTIATLNAAFHLQGLAA